MQVLCNYESIGSKLLNTMECEKIIIGSILRQQVVIQLEPNVSLQTKTNWNDIFFVSCCQKIGDDVPQELALMPHYKESTILYQLQSALLKS